MGKSAIMRMIPLRVPQIRLRAFQDELQAVKLNFLMWGWNWVCLAMVKEWQRKKGQKSREYQPHPGNINRTRSCHLATSCNLQDGKLATGSKFWDDARGPRPRRSSSNHTARSIKSRGRATRCTGTKEAEVLRNGQSETTRIARRPSEASATNQQSRPKQKACKLIPTEGSSIDTGRAAIAKGSPSSEDGDGGTEVLGRPNKLPAPKAHVPSEEELRPLDQRDRLAATARVLAPETFLSSEQVPLEEAPSVQRPSENIPMPEGREDEDRNAMTRVPSAEGSVRGTPTGVLCEQVVPLLRYLDRKVTKYGDPRQGGSNVELVQNQTRTEMAADAALIAQDQKYGNLEERYNFLQDQWALTSKLQKAALKLRDEMVERARRELNELRAKVQTDLSDERVQIRNLTEELVRKTRALEESEAARRADEELLGRLQSQCEELRAQRAAAKVQLAEEEDHNRRAADRTREELVVRVDRCLRVYTHWEIATQDRVMLRKFEMRTIALMSGNERSRQRVAKRLDSFLSKSREAITNLEAKVTEVLRRL
ncbi:hypothetical protein AXG93_3001s1050 [Marchantia polymorpha subsp. ruderalis]|uniref:Uncharacterized protein n=1 Tax=Marchantia polymorpha subsp. ruderalis TaxID=1480154 RepID=A0A176VVH6_MARPO|nr:hypothetical protein AXG93_3001s1050 [Marchantia polymorpha subsp. ruderalis]